MCESLPSQSSAGGLMCTRLATRAGDSNLAAHGISCLAPSQSARSEAVFPLPQTLAGALAGPATPHPSPDIETNPTTFTAVSESPRAAHDW
jgi:hypothetical protein